MFFAQENGGTLHLELSIAATQIGNYRTINDYDNIRSRNTSQTEHYMYMDVRAISEKAEANSQL